MKRYYIADPSAPNGFIEVTEAVFVSLIGTEETQPYAYQVYCGDISVDDVPESLREQVQTIVDYKISHCGEYNKQEIPADELKTMLEEVI